MADDYTSDPAFMAAPPHEQMAYLSHVDPAFAAASPQDQLGYLMHLHGVNSDLQKPSLPSAPDMKESRVPSLVKAGLDTIPVIGGFGGAIAGAPAFGGGSVVGAGLGAAAGETGRQALMNKLFNEGPSPVSKQGLTQTAIAGGVGAISEAPGALVSAMGGRALTGVTRAVPKVQTGNAMQAMEDVAPLASSGKGITQDLEVGRQALVSKLNGIIGGSKGTADIDALLANARTQASQASANPMLKGTLGRFNRVIEAAKINAGITNPQAATPQQLLSFMQELQKPAYQGTAGPTQALIKNLLQNAYSGTRGGLVQLAPGADQALSDLSNIYAAKAGVKSFGPNMIQSMAISARLHPRTTALVSPLATGAAVAGSGKARKLAGQTAAEMLP